MLTVMLFLAIGALIAGIAAAMGKCPDWVPIILLAIAFTLNVLPLK
jgi:hypothetical protein